MKKMMLYSPADELHRPGSKSLTWLLIYVLIID